jgi:chromosome partitioning protein
VAATNSKSKFGPIQHDTRAPATIIAFGSPKGGPGKTTLAVSMSAELHRRATGPVRLADLDITANAYNHVSRGIGNEVGIKVDAEHVASLVKDHRTLANKLVEMAKGAQFLILDTPGAIENLGAQASLQVADIVIVPISPSVYDLEGTMDALALMDMISARNPNPQLTVVVVNKPEKTRIDQQVQDALAAAVQGKQGVYLAKTLVRKAVGFKESAATGSTLWSLGASGKNPMTDIQALCQEVLLAHQEFING